MKLEALTEQLRNRLYHKLAGGPIPTDEVFNPATGRSERLSRPEGHTRSHTPTFRRCVKELMGKGKDEGAAIRICYSAGAGGEGKEGARKRAAAKRK